MVGSVEESNGESKSAEKISEREERERREDKREGRKSHVLVRCASVFASILISCSCVVIIQ